MTRKDYEIIARTFRIYAESDKDSMAYQDSKGIPHYEADLARHTRLDCLANSLANQLKLDNPNFNKNTFLVACGL